MKKRIMNMILAFTMLSALTPCAANAYDGTQYGELYYKVNDDGAGVTITDCDENAVDIVIPDEINDLPVTALGDYSLHHCDSLTSVKMPDSVTYIGNDAFLYCKSLLSVKMSNNAAYIGSDAFLGCTVLKDIEIPASVKYIGDAAFAYCDGLTSVEIPTGVTSVGGSAFGGCDNLTSVTIPKSVVSIGERAFNECGSLTSINVSEENPCYSSPDGNLYDKDQKTLMQYAIGKRESEYIMPDSVTAIAEYAFERCQNLKTVKLSKSLTSIGIRAFFNCPSLTDIEIPNGVISIDEYAFCDCYGLESVTIPASVTKIDYKAFCGCISLKSVEIPAGVTEIDYQVFHNCSDITAINVSDENQYYCSIDGSLFDKEGKTLIKYADGKPESEYMIPSGVTAIEDFAFWYCENLTKIEIPDGAEYIGDFTFFGCNGLPSIVIPESVTFIGRDAFGYCDAFSDVYYKGAKEEWKAIDWGGENDNLVRAAKHYNYGVVDLKIAGVSEVAETADGYSVTVEIINAESSGKVIAASYKDGRLAGIGSENLFSGDNEKTVNIKSEAADSVKIFIWDSLAGARPLCGAVEVPLS